jgi:asparagine synthase (glutamine-hydrolysing)
MLRPQDDFWLEQCVSVNGLMDALKHRGPDDHKHGDIDGWELVHTRLAIIDTSDAGYQPMQRGPLIITYNGEIFNYREIKEKLNGPWESSSDTEVLLALWEKYGEACLPMLDGQFAFAIYDQRDRSLTLARDRAGEKPLYHVHQNGTFAFASELKALTHVPGLKWEIDPEAFNLYMCLRFVPHPYSIIKGVQKLSPGHVLKFKDGKVSIKRWYSWEVEPRRGNISQADFRETVEEVEACLVDSVKKRLISDRPLGMFLSGGIDSSLTCAIASKAHGAKLETFSIGFSGDDKSEHDRARKTAQLLGANHHERIFRRDEFERVALSIGAQQDEPNGDRSCVPAALLSSLARERVIVALSGDGGDELFGGYGRYGADCKSASEYYERLLPVGGSAWAPEFTRAFEHLFKYPGREPIHALRQLDFHHYLPGVLAKMDRTSMQVGLEVRTPYLSPDLLEITRKLPTQYLWQGKMGKLVLRELAAKYIDRELAGLPKVGFGMPKSVFDEYMKSVETFHGLTFDVPPMNDGKWWINKIWAAIVFAQWANSFPVKL